MNSGLEEKTGERIPSSRTARRKKGNGGGHRELKKGGELNRGKGGQGYWKKKVPWSALTEVYTGKAGHM